MVRAAPKDDGEALKPLVFGLALLVAFGIATGAFAHICWVKLTPQELDAIKERGGSFRSHGGDDYATYGIEAIISHSVQHLVGIEQGMRAWSPADIKSYDDQYWDALLSEKIAAQEITALWKEPVPYYDGENMIGNSISYRVRDGEKQHHQYTLLGLGDEAHTFTVMGSVETVKEHKAEIDDQLASLMTFADRALRFR